MTKNYISNSDESARMFKNDFLEMLSKVHWSVPLFIYLPIIVYLLRLAIVDFQLVIFDILIYYILGITIWTLTEYWLHRFVFHYSATSRIGKRIHFLLHGVHHDYPNDSKRLIMPLSASILLALSVFYLFKPIFGYVSIYPFFAGFLTGYLIYDMIHYSIHHSNLTFNVLLIIKKHHMKHHYQFSDKGFGVSQPFWDYIFRTKFPK